jgi:hypothetical protein
MHQYLISTQFQQLGFRKAFDMLTSGCSGQPLSRAGGQIVSMPLTFFFVNWREKGGNQLSMGG